MQFITPVAMYAATFDTHQLVGCTVLGAPWSSDRRGMSDADVERDRLHPCLSRRARLASTTQCIQSRGHSPRTFFTGAPTLSVIPRREGVEARPYGVSASYPRRHQPLSHGARRRDSSPFRGAEGWAEVVTFSHLLPTMLIPTFICYP